MPSIYEFLLLSRLAAAPLLSSALSSWRLHEHKSSAGGFSPGYMRLLIAFIVSNATAALCQLCGATILYALLLSDGKISTSLRQGIVLVCIELLISRNLTWIGLCIYTITMSFRLLLS